MGSPEDLNSGTSYTKLSSVKPSPKTTEEKPQVTTPKEDNDFWKEFSYGYMIGAFVIVAAILGYEAYKYFKKRFMKKEMLEETKEESK